MSASALFCKWDLLLREFFECQEGQRERRASSALSSAEWLHLRGPSQVTSHSQRVPQNPASARHLRSLFLLLLDLSFILHRASPLFLFLFLSPFKFKRHALSNFRSPQTRIHRLRNEIKCMYAGL